MKVIINNIIPVEGFQAMTVWPFIFARKVLDAKTLNHESIHGEQQKEMLVVGIVLSVILWLIGCGCWSLLALPLAFYLYGLLYLVCLIRYRNHKMAYRNNPFEAEAYLFEADIYYLSRRKHFAWVGYIGKTTYSNT